MKWVQIVIFYFCLCLVIWNLYLKFFHFFSFFLFRSAFFLSCKQTYLFQNVICFLDISKIIKSYSFWCCSSDLGSKEEKKIYHFSSCVCVCSFQEVKWYFVRALFFLCRFSFFFVFLFVNLVWLFLKFRW